MPLYRYFVRKKTIHHINERLKKSYSSIATEFDQTRKVPWQEFDHFLAYTKHGGKVLDLGCGNGRFYEFLKPKRVHYLGVDHNSHQLDLARKNYPEAKFQLEDMMDLKLEKEAFDNVFAIASFHHIPGKWMREKVVSDMHRVLKADGILILTVWNLFQFRYLPSLLKGILKFILFLGLRTAWNDVEIKWGNYPDRRYYHAFLPRELLKLFPKKKWEIEEFYFTKKGKRVSFVRSHNFVLIVRKKDGHV